MRRMGEGDGLANVFIMKESYVKRFFENFVLKAHS